MRLGRGRFVALLYALLIGSLSVYLPFLVISEAGFSRAWGRGFSLQNLTLANLHYLLFEYPIARQSIIRTLVYAGTAASVCVLLGLAVAYMVHNRLYPGVRVLGGLIMAPFVIPGIVHSAPPCSWSNRRPAWITTRRIISRFSRHPAAFCWR